MKISFDEARRRILENVCTLGAERISPAVSLGRVLANDVAAPSPLPRYDNSAMDGYAVRTADCEPGKALPIAGYILAGDPGGQVLQPGTAMRIMTGGPIPLGCDAVVPIEQAGEVEGKVAATSAIVRHQHLRRAGEDIECGETVVVKGTVVRPAEISILAGFNCSEVTVYRRPRVAILSTGDELVELGQPLTPGKIVNSNGPALAAAVEEAGGLPVLLGIASDDLESHRMKLAEGLQCDALVTSAGVSVGDRDLVPEVLSQLGVKQVFRGVQIRPGSPTEFGLKDRTPVFSLPGNPVAALMMFELLVRPALLKMAGHSRVHRKALTAVLAKDEQKKPGLTRFLRVQLVQNGANWIAQSAGDQHTGMLNSLVRATGIAILKAEKDAYRAGDEVEVVPTSNSLTMEEG